MPIAAGLLHLVLLATFLDDPVSAFVGVRVVTEDDARTVLEDATVVVRDGRIEAVGPASRVKPPESARIHEGLGRTLVPGLIDAHVHLFGGGSPRFDGDAELAGRRALYFGVTCVLDLNAPDASIFALRKRERADPTSLLPRIFCSGAAITVPGGHGTEAGFPARLLPADRASEKDLVDALLQLAPDVVKLMIDEGGYPGVPPHPSLDDAAVARIVALAHAHGARVAAHVVAVDRARAAVLAGVDVLAHLPFVGDVDADFADLLAAKGTAVIPTLAVYRAQFLQDDLAPRRTSNAVERERAVFFAGRFDALSRAVLLLSTHGVKIVAGSDAGMPGNPHGSALLAEIESYVAAGIPAHAALRAATRSAAETIGAGDRLGRVAVGCPADLLLVDGNPLERISDLRRVVLVMKAGNIVPRTELEPLFALEKTRAEFLELRRLLDFEGAAPTWQLLGELVDKEGSRDAVKIVADEAGAKNHFLRLRSQQSNAPSIVVKAGLEIDLAAVLPLSGFSQYRAIRFRARAEGIERFRVLLVPREARDPDHFGQTFAAKAEFATIEIAFEDFTQVGFGDRRKLDLGNIAALDFVTDPSVSGAFTLDIDDVELVR